MRSRLVWGLTAMLVLTVMAAPAFAQYPPAPDQLPVPFQPPDDDDDDDDDSGTDPSPGNQGSASQTVVDDDDEFTAEACCFEPGTLVTFQFNPVLAVVTAGADGWARALVSLPPGTSLGTHVITASGTGVDGQPLVVSIPILVVADSDAYLSGGGTPPGPAPAVVPAPGGTLPATGLELTVGMLLAAALVLSGAAALVAARLRRRVHPA